MRAVGKSVMGMLRKNNEDAIFISEKTSAVKNLYIVADGMGGHHAGEIASNSAIAAFYSYLEEKITQETQENTLLDSLLEAVIYSNRVVYEKSLQDEIFEGMGTTFTAAMIEDEKLFLVHIGDSRCYLWRDGTLRQLTKDHSLVMEMVRQGKLTLEEAQNHPKRNVITRALGTDKTVEIDTNIEPLCQGDKLLLCSDGLSTMLTDKEIEAVLQEEKDLEETVECLIDNANEKGGRDNISVIMIG